MVLPAPKLDTRGFQDIVDELKGLIPRYCPEWTNHNVSDPGVALIELFAWTAEMVLYRLDQVPDRFYTKFLELVGIELFPPSVAHTYLTFWLSTILDHPVTVPAGTEVTTTPRADGAEVVVTTTDQLTIVRPELVAAATGRAGDAVRYDDIWDELRSGTNPVTCFTSTDAGRVGDAFYLGFKGSLAGTIIVLDVTCPTQGIGVRPPSPPIVWEAGTSDGWITAVVHEDTTGGLNQKGAVTLRIPLAHDPLTLTGTEARYWVRTRLADPERGQTAYAASPKVRTLSAYAIGGTVGAEHAVSMVAETIGTSNGQPGQVFSLSRPPVLDRRTDTEKVLVTTDTETAEWKEVDDFTSSTETNLHVVWNGAAGTISFGPSVRYQKGGIVQHGAIPKNGARISVTGYRHGGGAVGNLGADTLTVLRRTISFVDRVTNPEPTRGGSDGETVENAKLRGPMTLRTGQRAVTAPDFERLTREASTAIARVRCTEGAQPNDPIKILVVPEVARTPEQQRIDDFALDPRLVADVKRHLDARRMLGVRFRVDVPFYQGVSVAARIQSLPNRPAAQVRQRVLDLLYAFVNPLSGGADGRGWPFEADLTAAVIVQLIEGTDGVERVDDVLLFAYDLRTDERHGSGQTSIQLDADTLFLSAAHQVVVW